MYVMINLDKRHTEEEIYHKTLLTKFQIQKLTDCVTLVCDVTSSTELRQTEQELEKIGLSWDRMWVI